MHQTTRQEVGRRLMPGRRQAGATLLVLALAGSAGGLLPRAVGQNDPPSQASASRPEGLEFGHQLFRSRRYTDAADEYEAFLKTNPAKEFEAEARFGLANARHFLQEYAAARLQFELFLDLTGPGHPNYPTAVFRVGELAYVLGDLDTAGTRLKAYLSAYPGHRHAELALPYLGDVLYRQGDLQAAEATYRKALADFPNGRLADRARLYLGLTLAARDQPAEAEKILADLAARPNASGKDEALLQLGLLRAEAGRHEQAIDALETLERVAPQSRLVSRARLARAEALTALHKFDEADALLATLADDPLPDLAARASYAQGLNELKRDRPQSALQLFEAALAKYPESTSAPALRYRSAEALARLGQTSAARDRYSEMARSHPDDPWADEALAQAASLSLQLGQPEHATELARRLEPLAGEGPLRPIARLLLARAALQSGQPEQAASLLKQTLADGRLDPPTQQSARYYLALALRETGQAIEADQILGELAAGPPSTLASEARYLVGQSHFDAGRFAEAADALASYLADRPNGAAADHALARLAMARAELGQTDEARQALDELEKRSPQSSLATMARLRMGEKALNDGNAPLAVALLSPAAAREGDPLHPRALNSLGWALLKADNPAAAAEAFTSLRASHPTNPLANDALLALARALQQAGKTDEALAAYQQAERDQPGTPQASAALLARARLLAASNRPADAAHAYASYVENHLDADTTEPPDLVLSEFAWALLDAGKTDQADTLFRRILDEHPTSPHAPDARLNLAESAFQAGKYADVRALLEPLVSAPQGQPLEPAIDPAILQSALYRLGRAQVEQKDWDSAAASFHRLLSDFPDGAFHREARFWAAEVAFLRGNADLAEKAFAELASGGDAADQPWRHTARLRRVQSLALLKRWDDLLAEADSLAADAPDFPQLPELQVARAQALIALIRFDDARAALQSAIDARKGSELAAQAQFLRGESFFHQDNYREALRELLKAATLYDAPRWQAMALLEAGKVYEKLDRWADAARAYEDLRKFFPDQPPAAEAEPRLTAARQRSGSSRKQ